MICIWNIKKREKNIGYQLWIWIYNIICNFYYIFFEKKVLKKTKEKLWFESVNGFEYEHIFVVIGDVSTNEPPFISCLIGKKIVYSVDIINWIKIID